MAYQKKKQHKKSKCKKTLAQKTILAIIVLAIVTVFASILCAIFLNAEFQTKTKISRLSSTYYENYFYPKISSNNKNISEVLEHYKESGFSEVNLRQMILSIQDFPANEINFIYKYCDENTTFIHFFPEPPYDKTSYRVEYSYSCNF